jgi:zinc protease
MKSNGSMAVLLTNADVLLGDWNLLFEEISKVESVTIADVQRLANEYLTRSNRTIGEIIPEESN